jgi:hypothetical protein
MANGQDKVMRGRDANERVEGDPMSLRQKTAQPNITLVENGPLHRWSGASNARLAWGHCYCATLERLGVPVSTLGPNHRDLDGTTLTLETTARLPSPCR